MCVCVCVFFLMFFFKSFFLEPIDVLIKWESLEIFQVQA